MASLVTGFSSVAIDLGRVDSAAIWSLTALNGFDASYHPCFRFADRSLRL